VPAGQLEQLPGWSDDGWHPDFLSGPQPAYVTGPLPAVAPGTTPLNPLPPEPGEGGLSRHLAELSRRQRELIRGYLGTAGGPGEETGTGSSGPDRDTARHNSARQSSARQSSARQNGARQDTARQDTAHQDSARRP